MIDNKEKVIKELFDLMYVTMDYERTSRQYGTNIDISSSEIYMLKCIENINKANVTLLADMMKISKSAVSQAIKKLQKKGLIEISIDDENHSRYVIELSKIGRTAHEEHMNYRQTLFSQLTQLLDDYDENICSEMMLFLSNAKKKLKEFI